MGRDVEPVTLTRVGGQQSLTTIKQELKLNSIVTGQILIQTMEIHRNFKVHRENTKIKGIPYWRTVTQINIPKLVNHH